MGAFDDLIPQAPPAPVAAPAPPSGGNAFADLVPKQAASAAPPAAGNPFADLIPGQPVAEPAPQGAQPGFFSGLYRGMGESMKGVGQTAGLVSGTATPSQSQPDDALNQELKKSFFQGMFDPQWWTSTLGHAIGSAGPMVGGAMAGAAAGEAVEPAGGGLVGGALGGGLGNMIQTLGPTVKDNMAKGQNFNDALDSALKTTGMESTIVGAMSAVPGGKLLGDWAVGTARRAISEALINILGVQPVIGLVGQAGISAVEGKPITLDDLLTGYVQNVGLGAALHAGHVAAGKLLPERGAAEPPPPPAPALGKTTDDLLREMGTSTPPPESGLPGVTTALPRTTDEVGPARTPPIPSPGLEEHLGPVPSGEQVVKSGAEGVNAKPAIIDAGQPLLGGRLPRGEVKPAFDPTSFDPQTGTLRLYRGEGADQTKGGNWFTTDPNKAALYGKVSHIDVTPDEMRFAAQGHGGPDEVLFDNPKITARAQALEAAPAPELRGPVLPTIEPDTIPVWHGSPHEFDEFAPGKVGTGEGAASYGHGEAYVAENPDVAKTYQQGLATTTVGGEPFNIESSLHKAAQLTDEFGSRESAAQEVNARLARDPGNTFNRNVLYHLQADKELPPLETTGNLYRAQILGHPDEFLDLDKPLNQQSPQVQAAIANMPDFKPPPTATGEAMYYALANYMGSREAASERLSNAGIKGNRYLDQKSREVAATNIGRKQDDIDVLRNTIAEQEKNPSQPPRYIQNLKEQLAAKEQVLEDAKNFKPTSNYVVYNAQHVRALERNGTPIQKVLDEKPASAPMPKEITDEVAQGTHDTNDAIGELLQQAAAGGGGGREPPKPPSGGGPPPPDKGRRSLLGTADRIIAAVNTMPDDPLSYNRMSAAARVFGLAPGVAAADRTGATYLDSLTQRDATKHAGVFDGEAAAKDYGGFSYKRRLPIDKVSEYFDATGQEIPKPHADGSMTLTMDPKAFGELPWMLQLSEPGEKVHLDPKQVKALMGVRDFLDRRWVEDAESKARKVGYDGRFSTTDANGKLQIDLPTIKHAFDTATDKGLKKTAEQALGIAVAAKESKRIAYWPRGRYGDWTIRVTPLVPMTGTGHALPGETWFEKVESGTPFDSLKGVIKSEYGNTAPRKVQQRVAELEKKFPPDKYHIGYTKPEPKVSEETNVPMIERALDNAAKKYAGGEMTKEQFAKVKDEVIGQLYQEMISGYRQHREGVPGASTDLPRALGDYIRQSSNVIANNNHSRAVDEAYLNTQMHRDPRTASYWAAHKRYNDSEDSSLWSSARKVGFFKYLWGSPMSALIQLTQTPMITGSQLAGVIGPRGMWMVHTAMMRALQAMRVDGNGAKVAVESLKGSLTPGEYAGLMQALREGRLNPVLPHSLGGGTMSAKMRNSPIFKIPSQLYDIGSSMFNAADTANRVASWLSYYRAAQLPGAAAKFAKAYKNDALFQQAVGDHVDPTRLANWAINETQFMSGRQGGAPIMRGPGSLAFQFQHYNSNYIRLLHKNFTRMGPQGKVAGTLMLGGLMGAGGVLGFPFARDAEDAADAIGKFVFGIDPRIDAHIRGFLADSGMAQLADGYMGLTPGTTGEMIAEGPSRQLTGMDLGNRIGLGHMLPGTTDLTTGVPFLDATVGAAIEAHKRYATQQPLGAMAALMPAGLENPMKAMWVYPNEGVQPAKGGKSLLLPSQITPGMQIARGLGATPATIARKQQALSDQNRVIYATDEATKNLKNAIVGQYGLFEDAQKRGDTQAAATYAAKAQQLIKDNLDRLHDPNVPAWQQIPLPSPGQIRAGIMKYMNPFQIRNNKAMRSKQAELAASPYLQQ